MKQASFIFIAIIFIFLNAYSQESQPTVSQIQNSGTYIYGIGKADDFDLADDLALEDLISQISVNVESYFVNRMTEEDGDVKSFAESIVKTYSNITLLEAGRVLVSDKRGRYEVMRYISENQLDDIFESRAGKIKAYVKAAIFAEQDFRIGDALKNYYWGLVLLQSHKDRDKLSYSFDSDEQLLITAIPDRINNIFSDLTIKISTIEEDKAEKYKAVYLDVTFNGEAVENLDYVFWTGSGPSNLVGMRSGIAIVEFFGDTECNLAEVKINVEYDYKHKTANDLEVKEVFNNISLPKFSRATYNLPLPMDAPEEMKVDIATQTKKLDIVKINEISKSGKVRKELQNIIQSIDKKQYSTMQGLFTNDGWDSFNKLISQGNVKVMPSFDTLRFINLDGKVIVRSIPMKFDYSTTNRDFIEQVVFTFNEDMKVEAISFAVSDKAINDIVSKSDRFGSVEDKYHLINFMEHYKTAYCLKRLDYIESIFADNALIIVGHVVKAAEPIDGMYSKVGNDRVKYIELSKEDYIERLNGVFNSKEFVNIHFEESIVKKVNGDSKIYGIQIKQDYYSTNYADKGYLFLMIDLNDTINPKIYVRTWQLEKNQDGSIYGLSDFYIN